MKSQYIKYFAAMLLFGSNGIVASHIALSSVETVFMRSLFGSVLLLGIFLLSRGRFTFLKNKKQALMLVLSGVLMGASWMFLFEAYERLGVGMASLIYYSGPVIVMMLSPVFFAEKLTWKKLLGFFAVFAGIVLVQGVSGSETPDAWGVVCGLLSALTYAAMVVCSKLARDITGLENPAVQLTTALFTVGAYLVITQGFTLQVSPSDWLWIIVLGIVNTGVGCYLYFTSIGRLPVQTVAVCSYIDPLCAVILSVLILKESMPVTRILGAVLIIGGAVFAELSDIHRAKTENTAQ